MGTVIAPGAHRYIGSSRKYGVQFMGFGWDGVFTDTFSGTVALTTVVAANQGYQRSGIGVVFTGTSVAGGDPIEGMAYRIDGGAWKQLTNETITAGNWSGTARFPYYAQGTLEFKPINGDSVTPASVLNITVGEVVAINGQSNADGRVTNVQSYTPVNYTLLVYSDGTWAQRSSDPWAGVATENGPYMRMAELADNHTTPIPLILVRGHTEGGTSLSVEWAPPSGASYLAAVADMNAAGTAGWRCWFMDQGETDVIDASTTYEADAAAFITALRADVDNGSAMNTSWIMLGEVQTESTNLDAVRDDIKSLWETDARVHPGPNMLAFDYTDDLHVTTDAQADLKGEMWWRVFLANHLGGLEESNGPQIISTTHLSPTQLRITFDRAVKNHTDTTGWRASDDLGALTISSGAAATVTIANDSVTLTFSRNTENDVILSFGREQDAVGATLADIGSVADLPPEYENALNVGAADPVAPVNTVAVSIPGTAPQAGVAFTAIAGTYTGVPIPPQTYEWFGDDVALVGNGADTIEYTPQVADDGSILHVVETATNAAGSDSSQSADSLAVVAGFSPSSLFASGEGGGWWDPSDADSVWEDSAGTTAASVDGVVGRLDDKSGNDNHLVQATTADKPLWRDVGGFQYLEADGTDDYMQVTFTGLTQPNWIFLAVNDTGSGIGDHFASSGTTFVRITTASANRIAASAGTSQIMAAAIRPNEDHIFGFLFDGTSGIYRLDGVETHTSLNFGTNGYDGLTIFAREDGVVTFTGNLNQILIIDRALTAGEISDLETHFATKIDVTI